MIAVERAEECPDEVGSPVTDARGPSAPALLQAVIHRLEEGKLAFEFLVLFEAVVGRDTGTGEGGELVEFRCRRVTGGVLEDVGDGGRRVLRLAQLGQLAQEIGRGGGVGDAESDLGKGLPVLRAEFSRERTIEPASSAELIAEGLADDVKQVRVARRHAREEIQQGAREMAHALHLMICPGFGGAALHERVAVLQAISGNLHGGGDVILVRLHVRAGVPERILLEDAPRDTLGVNSDELALRARGSNEVIGLRRSQSVQQPEGVDVLLGIVRSYGGGQNFLHGLLAELVEEGVHRERPAREARGGEFLHESLQVCRQRGRPHPGFAIRSLVNDAPDAPARAVASGMRERHFVVPDDLVVEVGDVERAIRTELRIDGAEPRIVRRHEIRRGLGNERGAGGGRAVAQDAAGHDVAEEKVAAKFLRPQVVRVNRHAVDGGGAAYLLHHVRREAETIVRLAEAGIVAAGEELKERFAVAVGGEQVPQRIEGEAEGIHLSVRVMLDARAVETHAVGVAGVEINLVSITSLDVGIVVVAVRGVEPSVEAPAEARLVAVCVARGVEGAVEDFALVRLPIPVRVLQEPDVRNAPGDAAILVGINADGDVQSLGKRADAIRASIAVGVLENLDGVARRAIGRRGVRIFLRDGDPQAPLRVEGHVHRLEDVGFGGEELGGKSGREPEGFLFVLRRLPGGGADSFGEWIRRGSVAHGQRQGERAEHRQDKGAGAETRYKGFHTVVESKSMDDARSKEYIWASGDRTKPCGENSSLTVTWSVGKVSPHFEQTRGDSGRRHTVSARECLTINLWQNSTVTCSSPNRAAPPPSSTPAWPVSSRKPGATSASRKFTAASTASGASSGRS